MNRPSRLVPALVGGAFLGVTSALPILEFLNCACCTLVIGGGVLASYLYLKELPPGSPPLTYGEGALLGLVTGLVGGMVWTIVGIPIHFIKMRMGMTMQDMAELEEALGEAEIPEVVRQMLERIFSGDVLSVGLILVSAVTYFMASTIFATLGGVLGVAIFQKKTPPVETVTLPPTDKAGQ